MQIPWSKKGCRKHEKLSKINPKVVAKIYEIPLKNKVQKYIDFLTSFRGTLGANLANGSNIVLLGIGWHFDSLKIPLEGGWKNIEMW